MQKNINVKNVKEYVKKLDIYIKNNKVISNGNVNKKTNNTKKRYLKIYLEIYRNVYKSI